MNDVDKDKPVFRKIARAIMSAISRTANKTGANGWDVLDAAVYTVYRLMQMQLERLADKPSITNARGEQVCQDDIYFEEAAAIVIRALVEVAPTPCYGCGVNRLREVIEMIASEEEDGLEPEQGDLATLAVPVKLH